MPRHCALIATVTGREFRDGPLRKKRKTRACSIACWRRSAAMTWSAPHRSSIRARSITPYRGTDAMRLVSVAVFFVTWWIASLLVGGAKLPPPPEVLQVMFAQAKTGALFLNLGVTL